MSEEAATFPEHFNIDLTKFVTYFKPRGTSQRSNCILKWDPRADGQAQNICNIQNQNFLAMKKSEICVLIGSVDRGDSDVGERLWLSAAKTDPRHPVQTNQSPPYIAKVYTV